ncbi:SAM-dependent methyltransferase [Actinocatenispora sera]|uniref:class I SAM-dependent methyltransferase n=1 Tax=Actinocatenispora sera TaxID=390989 RepID=UPI0033F32CCD
MPEPLAAALADLRTLLTDSDRLVRAVAAGRRRGVTPEVPRVELRPVRIGAGPRLQIVEQDAARPRTRNVAWGADAEAAVAELLARPYGNWHVTGTDATVQLRVTKRGEAQVHRSAGAGTPADTEHDRAKSYLLPPDDELYGVIGGNAAKRRQVDAFLRALDATLPAQLPEPLRVVDLGCGNAYLSFAAYRYLTDRRGAHVQLTGVDIRADQRDRNTALADRLGWADRVSFVAGTIAAAPVDGADVVLALHACDTATDDALARAVRWQAPYVLAAPCCHHELSGQLRDRTDPLLRSAILRERFADVLTDAVRAELLRALGWSVEVVEFVDSAHTPRNVLLRGTRGGVDTAAARTGYQTLVDTWRVSPALGRQLADLLS